MNEKRKRDCEKEEKRVAIACPSVRLSLSPKQRSQFLADMKGWLLDWGEEDKDWNWLETLLDSEEWTFEQRRDLLKRANRGMGYALDQLTGASRGDTDASVCLWTQFRSNCKTEAPVQSFKSLEDSILKTGASALVAQMEEMRSGKWVNNKELHFAANGLFQAARCDFYEAQKRESSSN